MADNTTLNTGSGGDTIRTDDISGVKFPTSKISLGADGVDGGFVSSANPLPISDASGSLTVDNGGTFAVQVNGDALTSLQTLDNIVSGNEAQVDVITVPAPLSTTGGGVEATALRVTVATDSTGVLSVDDNGGSLTVDGTVAISGTVAVTDNAGTLSVDDGAGSLTVDNGGTFAVQVDGAALTALQLIDNIVQVEDAAHSNGHSGVMALAVRQDASGSLSGTDGDYSPLQVDSEGQLRTVIESTINVSLNQSTSPVHTDDGSFTVGTSKVIVAGALVDESSTDSADEGDAVAVRATANRQLIVTQRPNANGEGLDSYRSIDLDESEEEVKASAGKVYGWFLFNLASSVRYIKIYDNTAAGTTVGSTTPKFTFPIPAGSGANQEFANGIVFGTGITIAATTGVADADTGAPGANEVVANILYK